MKKKKYRLKKKEGNFYDINKNEIYFNIPVTLPGLKIEECYNISSNELNVFLAWIKSKEADCSPNTEPKFRAKWNKKSFNDLEGKPFDAQRLTEDPILTVLIFYSQSLSQNEKDDFEQNVIDSMDPTDLIIKIRESNPCKKGYPFRPAEQDGDVIGGNG